MKRVGLLLVGLLVAVAVGVSTVQGKTGENKEWRVLLPQSADDEMARRKEKAIDGSVSAASELTGIYSVYASEPQAIFWGMIAAENSHGSEEGAVARYNLGKQLSSSPETLQQRRARYWLIQVAKGEGQIASYAKSVLTEIDQGKYNFVLSPDSPEWNRWPKWPSTRTRRSASCA